MPVTVTPPNREPRVLELTAEPTYTINEQGGYADARIPATIDPNLAADMRLGEVTLTGRGGARWCGHVRNADTGGIVGQGVQTRFADFVQGRVYVASDMGGWVRCPYAAATQAIDVSVESESQQMIWTWEDDTPYKPNGYNGLTYYLPEAQAVTLNFTNTTIDAAYTLNVYDGSGIVSGFVGLASGTQAVSIPSTTYVSVTIGHPGATFTPSADYSVTLSSVSITAADSTLPGIVADIVAPAVTAGIIATTDIDSTLSHTFSELVFDCGSSVMDKLTEVLRHGDWRAYVEWRVGGLCFVFASRPTTPAYFLEEGSGDGWRVTVDAEPQSCDPLASIVRARYTWANGRQRYIDITDSDTSHYLVDKGITKYAVIDTQQTTYQAATLVANRWLVDGGREQYRATVTIEGSPGGRLASDHLPGELVSLTCADGQHEARITSGEYVGDGWAKLTLDNAPSLEMLLSQASRTPVLTPVGRLSNGGYAGFSR